MANDLKTAKSGPTDDYFKFTRHLNFWEQVGLAFDEDRDSIKLISYMFGEAIEKAWETWEQVIPAVWGSNFRHRARLQGCCSTGPT